MENVFHPAAYNGVELYYLWMMNRHTLTCRNVRELI